MLFYSNYVKKGRWGLFSKLFCVSQPKLTKVNNNETNKKLTSNKNYCLRNCVHVFVCLVLDFSNFWCKKNVLDSMIYNKVIKKIKLYVKLMYVTRG